jgi:hypothetical protein
MILGGTIGIIIVAMTVFFAVLPGTPFFKQYILPFVVRQVSSLLLCNVSIGAITIDPSKGLVASNVVLSDRDNRKTSLRANRVEAHIDMMALFRGRFQVRSIKISGLFGELLKTHRGLFAGPIDIIRLATPQPGQIIDNSKPLVRMLSAERCTVFFVDSVTKIKAVEFITSLELEFFRVDSLSFVMQAGLGHFSSPVWGGTVRSNEVKGNIGPKSLLFSKGEVRGDSVSLSMHGTIPFSLEKEWDLAANAETFAAGFSQVYKNVLPLKPIGKVKAKGALKGTFVHPALDATVFGYELQVGSVAVDTLLVQAHFSEDLLHGKARVWTRGGTADATVRANVSRLFMSPTVGKYTIAASAENVDIRNFVTVQPGWLRRPVFLADAVLHAVGSGLRRLPDTMSADIREITASSAASPTEVKLRVAQNRWDLTAAMKPDFAASGNGRYTNRGEVNGSFHVQADSIKRIASFFYKETVGGEITADALLSGSLKNPGISVTLQSKHLNWRDVLVSKLRGRFTLRDKHLTIESSFIDANSPIASALQGFVPGEFNGKAWVQASANGRIDSLQIDGDVRLSQCSYGRYHADSVSAHCRYAGQSLRWQSLAVKRGASAMHSDGEVSWAMNNGSMNADCKFLLDNHAAGTLTTQARFVNDSVAASVTAENLDPAVVAPWFPIAQRLQGSFSVHGIMAGTTENPSLRLTAGYDHAVSGGLVIAATGDLAYTNGSATATIYIIQKGSGSPLTVTAHIPVAWRELPRGIVAIRNGAVVTVNGDSVDYGGLINAFAPSVQSLGTIMLKGKLEKADGEWGLSCSTHIANRRLTMKSGKFNAGRVVLDVNVAGPLKLPLGHFTLNGDSIEYRGSLITGYFGAGSIANDMIKLDTLHLSCQEGGADLSAVVPVSLKNGFSFKKNGRISATFTAMPLTFAQPFMPDAVTINKGMISGRVIVEGADKGLPQGTGALSLRDGECYLFECDKPLGPLSADLNFKNDSLILSQLRGAWGKGFIEGKGWAALDEKGIAAAQSEINFKDLRLDRCYENLDLGIQSAKLNITKDSLLRVTADAVLANTRFTQDFSLIDLGAQLKKKAPQTQRPPNPLFDKVVLRIAVNCNDNLTFDSNLGKMLVDGTVTVAGRPDNPSVQGQFQLLNGFVYYLDRKFTITQGAVGQYDPKRINPSFDITATSSVSWYPPQGGKTDYDITLLVKGDLSDPVITLSAVPSLAQPQIISLLTFGTIQADFGADLGSRTGGALVSQQLAGFGTRKLARFLNVESVDIYGNVFDPSSEGPQLSITKQVSSRVAVTYTKGLTKLSQQMVMVSYRILSFLYLEAETDQQARGGIDLKFRYSH